MTKNIYIIYIILKTINSVIFKTKYFLMRIYSEGKIRILSHVLKLTLFPTQFDRFIIIKKEADKFSFTYWQLVINVLNFLRVNFFLKHRELS